MPKRRWIIRLKDGTFVGPKGPAYEAQWAQRFTYEGAKTLAPRFRGSIERASDRSGVESPTIRAEKARTTKALGRRAVYPEDGAEKLSPRVLRDALAKPANRKKTAAQLESAKHRETLIGRVEVQYDKHRAVVRSITILSVAVGAVKLNQRYPDGFTPLKLEASTVGVLGTGLAFFLARRFGWRRTSSTLVDVGVGMVSGTLASNVGSGKVPMLAKTGS